jgi:SAM-dependent methyltransferase
VNAEAAAPILELPDDYYERLFEVEDRHWWQRGMRGLSAVLLRERLARRGQLILDAGCGTGGFLRWALSLDAFDGGAGLDISAEAIELARRKLPNADLCVAEVAELPFATELFDVAVLNDVLQHIPEAQVAQSLSELRRVLKPDGTLLVRTGGARQHRAEREDWRIYDRSTLIAALESAGLTCTRITYANLAPSVAAAIRGRAPRAPTRTTHGIPSEPPGAAATIGSLLLRAEALLLARTPVGLPYGHTLLATATPTP